MAIKTGKLTPRPYARLLTMLSGQLIKNNTVALTELAKNSYDADANWVQIRIGNMDNLSRHDLEPQEEPFVEIEDDGDGMSFEIVRDAWMNPAAPDKYILREQDKDKTQKGRIIQGEKGIGRYAVFQIGKKVEIHTRERIDGNEDGREVTLLTDLSQYDEEILREKASSKKKPLFFDELYSKYIIRDKPKYIKEGSLYIEGKKESKKKHGTLIRITKLNYEWTYQNARRIRTILTRLQSPFGEKDFVVSIVFEGDEVYTFEDYDLKDVLDEALLQFEGSVDQRGICNYSLNGKEGEIDLVENLKKDWMRENKEHFFDSNYKRTHTPECGPFKLKFYVYNLSTINDKELARYIRDHRIYIYRDGIRIYPYGDSDNDWTKIDVYRGTRKAGYYLSNDQVIGYVGISWRKNKELRDKTNREGLLEQGTAYEDLRLLTLSVLNLLNTEFQKLKIKPELGESRPGYLYIRAESVEKRLSRLKKHLSKEEDKDGERLLATLKEAYKKERNVFERRVEIVEDLAGVGIAVDATSHDLMVVMSRAVEQGNEVHSLVNALLHSKNGDIDRLADRTDLLKRQLEFMKSLLVGIQPLFRSSRRRDKELRILNILQTVKRYYEIPLKNINAHVEINEEHSPLIIKANEGVLLQVFINLIDNSVYWLSLSKIIKPLIEILINGKTGTVIFADNGPGIKKEDVDYIFEPFFSTKGIHGRGLGLYIARQLTDRYGYDLCYLQTKNKQIQPGANFKIEFNKQSE